MLREPSYGGQLPSAASGSPSRQLRTRLTGAFALNYRLSTSYFALCLRHACGLLLVGGLSAVGCQPQGEPGQAGEACNLDGGDKCVATAICISESAGLARCHSRCRLGSTDCGLSGGSCLTWEGIAGGQTETACEHAAVPQGTVQPGLPGEECNLKGGEECIDGGLCLFIASRHAPGDDDNYQDDNDLYLCQASCTTDADCGGEAGRCCNDAPSCGETRTDCCYKYFGKSYCEKPGHTANFQRPVAAAVGAQPGSSPASYNGGPLCTTLIARYQAATGRRYGTEYGCPGDKTVQTPLKVPDPTCGQRDTYVDAGLLNCWAADCYARNGDLSAAAGAAAQARQELGKADALCSTQAVFDPMQRCSTLDFDPTRDTDPPIYECTCTVSNGKFPEICRS